MDKRLRKFDVDLLVYKIISSDCFPDSYVEVRDRWTTGDLARALVFLEEREFANESS